MADFTHGFWSWFVGISMIISIIAVFVLVKSLTMRRRGPNDAPVETMGHIWDETLEEYNNPMPRWWLNLFYITLAWGFVYLALYPGLGAFKGLLGWSQVNRYEEEIAAAAVRYGPLFEQYQQVHRGGDGRRSRYPGARHGQGEPSEGEDSGSSAAPLDRWPP